MTPMLPGCGDASYTPQEAAERIYGDRTLALDVVYQLMRLEETKEDLERQLGDEQRRLELCIRAMGPVPEPGTPLEQAIRRIVPGFLFFAAGMIVFALLFFAASELRPGGCAGAAPASAAVVR